MALRQRLLHDIAELQAKSYPNITLFPSEDITKACLVLTPNGASALHLTIDFGSQYPLHAPTVTIESEIVHPNVFGTYICASILNTDEGYTSAYTLKGIAIQLLSFFSSDTLEQEYGGSVDLAAYKIGIGNRYRRFPFGGHVGHYRCKNCGFGHGKTITNASSGASPGIKRQPLTPIFIRSAWKRMMQPALPLLPARQVKMSQTITETLAGTRQMPNGKLADLPDEILLDICNSLDIEELMIFAKSWSRIGGTEGVITKFDLIRIRELQCFCLKEPFTKVKLGVGVNIVPIGRQGVLESEFDLLSYQAFKEFGIRRSVQGLPFRYWLPLPISRRHYTSVKDEAVACLQELAIAAQLTSNAPVEVIFSFMNAIVVKLSQQATEPLGGSRQTSTLKHASEKAIESYFHLFHLLLCLATQDSAIIRSADETLNIFLSGRTAKDVCPNLGHLLIAVLISNVEMTQDLMMTIIRETITRNVVWMLDAKGANCADLSYMEGDSVSKYRLQKTFEASKTSYRLLMFLNLFRCTTNRGAGAERKSLEIIRDEIFDQHGAPPKGSAARLASEIKQLQNVNTFPDFLTIMGVTNMPTATEFTTFLRQTLEDSVAKGYSVWGMSQEKALELRRAKEPDVKVREDPQAEWRSRGGRGASFFPNKRRQNNGRGRGSGR